MGRFVLSGKGSLTSIFERDCSEVPGIVDSITGHNWVFLFELASQFLPCPSLQCPLGDLCFDRRWRIKNPMPLVELPPPLSNKSNTIA